MHCIICISLVCHQSCTVLNSGGDLRFGILNGQKVPPPPRIHRKVSRSKVPELNTGPVLNDIDIDLYCTNKKYLILNKNVFEFKKSMLVIHKKTLYLWVVYFIGQSEIREII